MHKFWITFFFKKMVWAIRGLYIFKINSVLKLFEYETEEFFPIQYLISKANFSGAF